MTTRTLVRPFAGRRTRVATAERGPRIFPLALFVLAVIGLFFLMIYLRIALDETAFELESIERRIEQAESVQLDLRLEQARLQDPLRIATEAERLGLTYPDQRVPVVVEGLGGTAIPAPTESPMVETPTQAFTETTP